MHRTRKIALYLSWFILCFFIFDKFAYEINEFNASTRVFVVLGKTQVRSFEKTGLPRSFSPKIGKYLSPFYVVHYAIMYSNLLDEKRSKSGLLWRLDPSISFWNVPPKIQKSHAETYFKNCVDWLVDKINREFNGKAHYLYDFNWKYKGYENGALSFPWWSGLTDAYAIIPLLRAYELFGDIRYLKTADDLYLSVTSKYEHDGSMTSLGGYPWIEEYVDPSVNEESKFPFVLNGMVYSTYAIEVYEMFTRSRAPYAPKLYESIFANIFRYDMEDWSLYDILGNAANIKYHRIQNVLLKDLIESKRHVLDEHSDEIIETVINISDRWNKSMSHLGLYYILYGPKSVAYYHFLCLFIVVIFAPFFLKRINKVWGFIVKKNE